MAGIRGERDRDFLSIWTLKEAVAEVARPGLFVDPKMVEIDGGGAEVSVTYQGGALEGWTVVSRFHPDLPDIVVGLACRAAELQWREPLTAERLICSMTSTDQRNVTP